ncbi:hypothetical protein [Cellulomonas sp. RIT-PI-Y]|uniref:hypothetical protein n=1 Tax=Cellulomonas sp. RIT-PI-Y TaxID=3035297 RepID=UPI0021DA9FDF|nr:hypothetical protein [Cellulomonas sp. RIT-PI-Y]
MSHTLTPTSTSSIPWWRRVLTLEPVAVQAAVRAVVLLVGAVLAVFGLDLPDNIEPWLLGVVAAFYVAVEAITTMLARSKATPAATVVQTVEPDGTVVAGPASPLPTGAVIEPEPVGIVTTLDGEEHVGEIPDAAGTDTYVEYDTDPA